ncbi:MAG: hypothetical protein ACRD0C_03410 [Acidimicrobiia bacterium]
MTMLDGGTDMRDGGRLCLEKESDGLTLKGCWDVRTKASEADPEHDYLIWMFRGGVTPDGPRKIGSLTALIQVEGAEVAWWNPSRDLTIDDAGTIDASYQRPDGSIPNEHGALPGRVHPVVNADRFSVEWTPTTTSISGPAEVGAVVELAMPQGRSPTKVTTSLEAVLGRD